MSVFDLATDGGTSLECLMSIQFMVKLGQNLNVSSNLEELSVVESQSRRLGEGLKAADEALVSHLWRLHQAILQGRMKELWFSW